MRGKRKRVEKVVVDTSKTVSQLGIQIPRIDYKVVADISMRTAFKGRITPVPTVLIHYLRPIEFQFVAIIIEETIETGECMLKNDDFALRLKVTNPTIYKTKYELRRLGLLIEEKAADRKYRYSIDWSVVDSLEKLTINEPKAIMRYLRSATQKRAIKNLTKEDIENAYTEKILPFEHDPREEEIYD